MKNIALISLIVIGLATFSKSADLGQSNQIKNTLRFLQEEIPEEGVEVPVEVEPEPEPQAPVVDENVSLEQSLPKPEESVGNPNGSDIPYQIDLAENQSSIIPLPASEEILAERIDPDPESVPVPTPGPTPESISLELADIGVSNFQEPSSEELVS
jgi:hypothetical protein